MPYNILHFQGVFFDQVIVLSGEEKEFFAFPVFYLCYYLIKQSTGKKIQLKNTASLIQTTIHLLYTI